MASARYSRIRLLIVGTMGLIDSLLCRRCLLVVFGLDVVEMYPTPLGYCGSWFVVCFTIRGLRWDSSPHLGHGIWGKTTNALEYRVGAMRR